MPTMTPVPATDPLMIAWTEYIKTGDFSNAEFHARTNVDHVRGSLWAAFEAGFRAATERAADLHEEIDPASNAERLNRIPGAGAMGAVIEYRDKIRETIVVPK